MIDSNIDNYLYIIEQTDLIYDYTINGVVDKTNLVNNLINIIVLIEKVNSSFKYKK